MASYYCDYVGDNGSTYQRVGFEVYYVDTTLGARGNRVRTTVDEDRNLLPSILSNYLIPQEPKLGYCSLSFNYRNVLIWVSQLRYLHAPIPWLPNSPSFTALFDSLSTENSDILTVGINGEFIEPSLLQWLVTT